MKRSQFLKTLGIALLAGPSIAASLVKSVNLQEDGPSIIENYILESSSETHYLRWLNPNRKTKLFRSMIVDANENTFFVCSVTDLGEIIEMTLKNIEPRDVPYKPNGTLVVFNSAMNERGNV